MYICIYLIFIYIYIYITLYIGCIHGISQVSISNICALYIYHLYGSYLPPADLAKALSSPSSSSTISCKDGGFHREKCRDSEDMMSGMSL